MNGAEFSPRFTLAGLDPQGRSRTLIGWRDVDLVEGQIRRRVVVTLDATLKTAVCLSCPQAVELAEAIPAAAT